MTPSLKEKKLDFKNVFISTSLLWLVLQFVGSLGLVDVDPYMASNSTVVKAILITMVPYFLASLVAGFLVGKIVKKNPLHHGFAVGLCILIAALLTMVSTRVYREAPFLLPVWALVTFVPVWLGSYIGSKFRK